MSVRAVLGVDFGSTTAKAVLASDDGEVIATASVPQHVRRGPSGEAEQDPRAWWADLQALVRSTLGTADRRRDVTLAGLAISGHLPTLVLVDADGRLLGPAMLYADRRADAFIEEARRLSGQALGGDELLPKLLWLAERDPQRLEAARRLHNLYDFLVHKLTGVRTLDHRTAMRSGLFDPVAMDWRRDLVAFVGLDPSALPSIARGGDVAGPARAEAAADLGIPPGTPVLVGLGDTPATMVGAGAVHAGEAMVYYGTTTTLDVCTHDFEAYLRDPTPIRDWAPYREVGYAVLGPAMAWVARGLAGAEDRPTPDLGALDGAAAALPPLGPDAPFVIPSFDAHAADGRSAPSAIIGLHPSDDRAALHRAMLESFAFVARAGLEDGGFAAGARGLLAAGGGARSPLWRQIVSDTLGAPQDWAVRADASLGMAMLAARATLGADPLGDGLAAWLGAVVRTNPDPAGVAVQELRYARWRAIRSSLARAG